MIYTVQQFCNYISRNRVDELAEMIFGDTGRALGPNERESYSQVSIMLKKAMALNPAIANAHVSVDTSMLLEYKLPAASAWCDVVMLGKNEEGQNQVLIIELKNWQPNKVDKPGPSEGLMWHNNEYHSHPSQQVRGYTEYCRRFHSTVQDLGANCHGVVYFTKSINMDPYREAPNDRLVANYPTYNTDTMDELSEYISKKITKPDTNFARMFVDGVYKQDRDILRQVAETVANRSKEDVESPFQLLGPQILGYDIVMSKLAERVKDGKKQVIVVEGPPGSGKSAVAINVWAAAALKYTANDEGNCVFVSTSQSQDDNWRTIFKESGGRNAAGLILKGSSYGPGPTTSMFPSVMLRMQHNGDADELIEESNNSVGITIKRDKYAEVTDYLVSHGMATKGYKENQHLLSVVDEAHALVNPLSPDHLGVNQGWAPFRGPQAYHIIRQSQVTVFFTDNEQSFRDYESTSTDDIERFARELGADFEKVSLAGMQFRCAGSVDFVEWVDRLLTPNPADNYDVWKDQYEVRLFDYPSDLEEYLQKKRTSPKTTIRLLSSYSVPWASQGLKASHPANSEYDFVLEDKDGKIFKKYWNSTNAAFVQAIPLSTMESNPLSEVGCPYIVRGFDYSYIGLIWLKDVIYRKDFGGWCISAKYMEETAIKVTKSKALAAFKTMPKLEQKKYTFEGQPLFTQGMAEKYPEIKRLFKSVSQAYRILMTRALKGLGIYIQDEETRKYVKSLLK